MKALTIFEGKFSRLKEERENVSKAKEALELSEPGKALWYTYLMFLKLVLCVKVEENVSILIFVVCNNA